MKEEITKQRYLPPTVQSVCIPHILPSLLATMSMPGQIEADWTEFGALDESHNEEWGS